VKPAEEQQAILDATGRVLLINTSAGTTVAVKGKKYLMTLDVQGMAFGPGMGAQEKDRSESIHVDRTKMPYPPATIGRRQISSPSLRGV
jgi:hypothetical protein